MHHFEHSRDDLLQDICLFVDDFICDLIRQRHNTLQSIEKPRWYLVAFDLFLQELSSHVTSVSDIPVASTNLKCDTGNTENSLCNRVQLTGVNLWLVSIWKLTSANTAPYLIPFSTALSVGPLISGEYPFNNSSSFWSDERRDSAYANINSLGGQLWRNERYCLRRIVILESSGAFQQQRPLRFPIR